MGLVTIDLPEARLICAPIRFRVLWACLALLHSASSPCTPPLVIGALSSELGVTTGRLTREVQSSSFSQMRNDERTMRHITKCPSTLLGRIHVPVVVETSAIAAPTHRADSGAEVLSLHLSDALVKANRNGRSATQPAHLGAVHLVQSVTHFLYRRALRRICSDGSADSTRYGGT